MLLHKLIFQSRPWLCPDPTTTKGGGNTLVGDCPNFDLRQIYSQRDFSVQYLTTKVRGGTHGQTHTRTLKLVKRQHKFLKQRGIAAITFS